MTNPQEALASLRVLVCIATADGSLSPSEQAVLTEALEQLEPPEAATNSNPITLEALLAENIPFADLLPSITTPAAQQAVEAAAQALAEQGGIHPQQQQLLDQIQACFHPPLTEATSSPADPKLDADVYESLTAGIQAVTRRNCQARDLILDYALGAAVIGLIPLRGWLIAQLVVVSILIIKMRRDIGGLWGFPGGQDALAWVGSWFGSLGAFAIALVAWLTVLAVGVVMPYLDGLARAAAFATLVWVQGQATNQFYLSSKRMDQVAFQQTMQFPDVRANRSTPQSTYQPANPKKWR